MLKLVVLFSIVALAAAKPGYLAAPVTYGAVPVAYSAVPAHSSVSQYSSSVVHGSPVLAPAVYSAPVVPAVSPVVALSQAPHSPDVVLDAVHGVPLDTPEVVAARAAHYQAKALSGYGYHHLRKRSLGYSAVVAPVTHSVVSPYSPVLSSYSSYSGPVVSAYSTPVVSAYSTPLVSAYSAPVAVVPKAYSVHPW